MLDLGQPPLVFPTPTIIRPVAGGLLGTLDADMARAGISQHVRRAVICELNRVVGCKDERAALADLSRWGRVNAASLASKLLRATSGRFTPSFANYASSSTNDTSYTLAITNMVANSRRLIGVMGRKASPSLTIDSVTCDGQAGVLLGSQVDNSGTSAAFFIAPGTASTSGNVVVNLSGTWLRCVVGVWNLPGLVSTTPDDQQSDITGTTLEVVLSVLANGAAFAIGIEANNTGPAWTWVSVDEDFDISPESGNSASGASKFFTAAQPTLDITGTLSSSAGVPVMLAVSLH